MVAIATAGLVVGNAAWRDAIAVVVAGIGIVAAAIRVAVIAGIGIAVVGVRITVVGIAVVGGAVVGIAVIAGAIRLRRRRANEGGERQRRQRRLSEWSHHGLLGARIARCRGD